MNKIINKHCSLLKNDPFLKSIIPNKPKLTFRRATTIKNTIAPSRLRNSIKTIRLPISTNKNGCSRCLHPRCKCCPNIIHGVKNNTSCPTGATYPIKTQVDCSSSYVIYILTCTCKLQYTQALRIRVNQHRSNCTRGYTKHSVSRHATTHHSNSSDAFNIAIIEQIHADIPDRFVRLQRRKMFWIYKFNTITLFGLNVALESVV